MEENPAKMFVYASKEYIRLEKFQKGIPESEVAPGENFVYICEWISGSRQPFSSEKLASFTDNSIAMKQWLTMESSVLTAIPPPLSARAIREEPYTTMISIYRKDFLLFFWESFHFDAEEHTNNMGETLLVATGVKPDGNAEVISFSRQASKLRDIFET